MLCGVFLFLCLLATIFEVIKDFYKEKDAPTIENAGKFPMDKTANEKTPLFSEIEKADNPKIKIRPKGVYCFPLDYKLFRLYLYFNNFPKLQCYVLSKLNYGVTNNIE